MRMLFCTLLGAAVLFLCPEANQAGVPISSPEATTTTYVQDGSALVFAPRAARAQKVIFDTPDQQLIYEPDTPFRKFFDSHSPDFKDGSVDYAKTTILGDMISMLHNREYIRLMIENTVTNYIGTAIDINPPCKNLERFSNTLTNSLAQITDGLTKALTPNSVDQVHAQLTNEFALQMSKLTSYAKLAGIDNVQAEFVALQNTPDWKDPQKTSDSIGNLGKMLEEITRETTKSPICDLERSDGTWGDRHARLLTDSLYLELLREGYPEMRYEDIRRSLHQFAPDIIGDDQNDPNSEAVLNRQIWEFTTGGTNYFTSKRALVLELLQVLKERRYFQLIIDQAVQKRVDLFRATGSPTEPLRNAETAMGNFVNQNLFNGAMLDGFVGNNETFWNVFLNNLNADGTNRVLRMSTGIATVDRPMDGSELNSFGTELKKALELDWLGKADGKADVTKAVPVITKFFSTANNQGYLRPNYGTDKTIDQMRVESRARWIEWTAAASKVQEAHEAVKSSVSAFNGTNAPVLKACTNFADAVATFIIVQIGTMPVEQRIEATNFSTAVNNLIVRTSVQLTSRSNLTDLTNLRLLLTNAFAGDIELETSAARKKLISDFTTLFKGDPGALSSEQPMLATVLKTGPLTFPESRLREQAAGSIPKKFKELWGTSKEASRSNIVAVVNLAMETPENSYLFGFAPANPQVVEAFKKEFYNSFKHRLSEALAAEQEAAYDYWWITFYPKAIPLGNKRFEGESIIELGFPEMAVPQEQYHRWIQDHHLLNSPVSHQGNSAPPARFDEQSVFYAKAMEERAAVENKAKARLSAAISVTRDFLTAMESSDLSLQYERLRPGLMQVLGTFADKSKRKNDNERFAEGMKQLCLLGTTNISEEQVTKWLAGETVATNMATHCSNQGMGPACLRAQLNEGIDTNFVGFCEYYFSQVISTNSAAKSHGWVFTNLNELRVQLGWVPLDFRHAFVAIAGAAESGSSLPEKVNLYSYAFFPGSRAFVRKMSPTDQKIGNCMSLTERIRLWSSDCDECHPKISEESKMNLTNETNILSSVKSNLMAITDIFSTNIIPSLLVTSNTARDQLIEAQEAQATVKVAMAAKLSIAAALVRATSPVVEAPTSFTEGIAAFVKTVVDAMNVQEEAEKRTQNAATREKQEAIALDEARSMQQLTVRAIGHLIDACKPATDDSPTEIEKRISKSFSEISEWATTIAAATNLRITNAEARAVFVTSVQNILEEVTKSTASIKVETEKDRNISAIAAAIARRIEGRMITPLLESSRSYPEDLREIIVNSYFSAYPGVPDREAIKQAFMKDPNRVQGMIYSWLAGFMPRRTGNNEIQFTNELRVTVTKIFDDHPFLTPEVRNVMSAIICTNNARIEDICRSFFVEQRIMDELSTKLFDAQYQPLFDTLSHFDQTERNPIAYEDIGPGDYESFQNWYKPHYQRGIQIVDLLPASRDDLVSMSINEGGVIAKAAGQAEGAAAYDLNQMQMVLRNAELAGSQAKSLIDNLKSSQTSNTNGLESDLQTRSSRKKQSLDELSSLKEGGSTTGYSLGAAAQGSVYARAQAAMAYSRRREYLDAAITSAGRGDNFAKWVVRKSDLRSALAGTNAKKLVAAAHNGFPNGDQPFFILLKVPRKATFTDWNGNQYIYFNSSYSATTRLSLWKEAGFGGLIVKTSGTILNPNWWSAMEESTVGTVYPFKWNVTKHKDQAKLLSQPNALGGRLWLDEHDKIKYSEVTALVEAEANFVKLTREAQSQDISKVLDQIRPESASFRSNVMQNLTLTAASRNKAFQTNETNSKLISQMDALNGASSTNSPSSSGK